jgi:ribosome-associated protein
MAKKATKKAGAKPTTKKLAAKPAKASAPAKKKVAAAAARPAAKLPTKLPAKPSAKPAAKKPAPKKSASKQATPKLAAAPASKARTKAATKPTTKPTTKPATKPARSVKAAPALKPEFLEHDTPTLPAIHPSDQATNQPASSKGRQAKLDSSSAANDALPADAKLAFAIEAARLVRDDNCDDVVVLDVRATSHVSDYIVVATGTSDRQMRSVLDHVENLGAQRGFRAFRTSRDDRATWLLADFVDVVVHLFEPTTRSHYDLEMLWGDAPRIEWQRADQQPRDRAGLG